MKKIISLFIAAIMFAAALAAALPSSAASGFSDVENGRWSASSIGYAVNNGYMNGVGGGKFDPEGSLTRAMVATVLWRREGSPAPTAPSGFADVPAGEWYTDAVAWAKETGVVKGLTETTFGPDEYITREQLATMLFRFSSSAPVSVPERADLTPFADDEKVSDWADEPLEWAVEAGIVNGTDGNRLAPDGFATREQFAAIIERYDGSFKLVYNEPILRSHYTEKEYPLVGDADFYVSTTGSDDNDGSIDRPFRTWERARDAVRALDKTGRSGIKVAFMAGEYGELYVTLTAEDSGTEDCPVTYCAYGDGDVVFRNGAVIKEDEFLPLTAAEKAKFPENAREDVYRVSLSGKVDSLTSRTELIGGDGFCWEARFPNKYPDGTDRVYTDMTTTVDERASIRIIGPLGATVAKFGSYDGLKVTGYLRTGWFQDTFPVKSYDKETHVLTFDFDNYDFDGVYSLDDYVLAYEGRMEDTVFFSGLPEFLDEPGEYWFDTATKDLYVCKPNGDYSIPLGDGFLTVGKGADFITIKGLSFIGTQGNAVTVDGDYFTVERCRFGDVCGQCVIDSGNIFNLTLRDSELFHFSRCGVALNSGGDYRTLDPSGHVIENNLFYDFGLPIYFEGADAIAVKNNVGTLIRRNEFRKGAHGAVRIDFSIDTVIEYNVFDGMMKNTQDFGAVYSFMSNSFRDNVVRYNLFENIRSADAQHGVYLDGADGFIIYGNLFYNSGSFAVTFNGGRDNDVHDNVIIAKDKENRNAFMYSGHRYELAIADDPGSDYDHELNSLLAYYADMPGEGEPGYEIWKERWPILYEFDYDKSSAGQYYSLYSPVNVFSGNKIIGAKIPENMYYEMFALKDGTETFTTDENPLFVNPTRGDYRLRDGVDFPDIHFEDIGRY